MPGITFNTKLKPSQIEGCKWLIKEKRAGLDYSTGIGKTLISFKAGSKLIESNSIDIIYIFHLKSGLKAIQDEAYTHRGIHLNRVIDTGKILPVPYFNLMQRNQSKKFGTKVKLANKGNRSLAILDEIQYIKKPESKLRKIFDKLNSSFSYVWGLTATPVGNKLDDLYWTTSYILPNYFGNYYSFRANYCILNKRVISVKSKKAKKRVRRTIMEVTGNRNLKHLQEKIKGVWLIKSETMPKEFKFYNLGKLTQSEELLYLEAAKGVISESKDLREFVNRLHPLQRAVDLTETKLGRFYKALTKYKSEGRGCLVYFAIKDSLYALRDRLNFHVEILTGDTSLEDRGRIKDEFAKDKFILCTAAGSRSFNFEAVNTVMFYNVPFEIEIFDQFIGRVSRPFITKHDKIIVIMPYVEDTIDVYRIELMKANAALLKDIVPGGSPNLPDKMKALRRDAIIKLRKNLLWRLQNVR